MTARPGYATPAAPSGSLSCGECGAEVTSADPGGYWLLDGAPVHTGCATWTGRPFPYAWAVREGERATTRLTRSVASVPEELRRALEWLRWAAQAWPSDDPVQILHTAARAAAIISNRSRPGPPEAGPHGDARPGVLGHPRRGG